jgi:hypothetical protein
MSVSTQPGQIALGGELGGERAHEPEQGRLRCAVARVLRDGDPREDRGEHDDVPRVGAGRQVLEHRADAVVRPVDVRLDDVVEPVAALVVDAVRAADAARGDERVDRAELAGRTRERPLHPPALPDVAGLDPHASLDRGRRGLEGLAPACEERQRRALAGEPHRDGATDARAGSRHYDVLPVQPVPTRSQFAAFPSSDPLAGARCRA